MKSFSLLYRTKADHVNTLDEFHATKKTEVNSLQDLISEKDRTIVDLNAQISSLSSKMSSVSTSAEDETKMLTAKVRLKEINFLIISFKI